MSSTYYSAAWTECGCLIGCRHHHQTVSESVACIRRAGGYVAAVENGAIRSLTAEEESEFQCAVPRHSTDRPAVETTPAAPAEVAVSNSDYAVVTRIRVGDHCTWTTWMRFKTYAEAVVHTRQGNNVVRFRSPGWAALLRSAQPASSSVRAIPHKNPPPRGEGETLLEFVLRFLASQTQNES